MIVLSTKSSKLLRWGGRLTLGLLLFLLQDIKTLQAQVGSQTVNVEVDAAPQEDLTKVMAEIREQYDAVAAKNHKELESWFNAKVQYQSFYF